ncbi:hypothetical protein [Roseateles depolymerans]|uniref:Uncharacterized protein n=1 Tax=Roseateles depolymerans TaxID=76731 RepID=A0A0U2U3N8_9BURK|nr:hypothetical protein [Roseateles depolymerans]ALV06833.1 hypothetical protein RD2015_2362 [Roseateles depolymerans]REG19811.1 hypothetical protein DES44_2317 [Roseateles depolymerans]
MELLVGLALGLSVVSAALAWAGQSLGAIVRQHRAWQLHQDLRAIAQPLQMELRRAGAHGRPSLLVWQPDATAATASASSVSANANANASANTSANASPPTNAGTSPSAGAAPTSNPFTTLAVTDAGTTLRLSRALDANVVQPDAGTEVAFRWIDGRMDQTVGGRFQPMTDPVLMQLQQFRADIQSTAHLGDRPCADTVLSRTVQLQVQAQPTQDATFTAAATWSVHVRNDQIAGACP